MGSCKGLNYYFPAHTATAAAIKQTFCGLRVLPGLNPGLNSVHHASREIHFVHTAKIPGYLAIQGGKLTSFYATALKGLHHLAPFYARPLKFNQASIQQPEF